MKKLLISTAMLAFSLLILGGCGERSEPVGAGGSYFSPRFQTEAYGYDTTEVYSGGGDCGTYADDVLVRSECDTVWQPALIGGGGPAPACSCTVTGGMLEMSMPLTTRCPTDSTGTFRTTFTIPDGAVGIKLDLAVIADDGAEVWLGDKLLGTVDLFGGGMEPSVWTTTVTGDSMFNLCPDGYAAGEPALFGLLDETCENVLEFRLVNTGTGAYGDPVARADTADCMYVQFEADVTWLIPPHVTIDIKPGSDDNPVNCNGRGNGVIPVAILTTDEFDARSADPATLRFGPGEAAEAHGKAHWEDVDYDGDIDMMLHFRIKDVGVSCSDTILTLRGSTIDGFEFESSDHIKTVPVKGGDDGGE